jgi:outer membrane protein assembly factor BamD
MTFKIIKNLGILITACSFATFFGCASAEKNLNTPEGLFAQAKNYEKSDRFEIAITKYNDIKNKYPYSSVAVDAELAIADAQYTRENYADAQIAYQNFRDLHPKHIKIDYVVYRTAMSYYMQLPDTTDRDQTLGNDAIYHFDEIIKSFSKSEFVADAKIKRQDVYNRLAEKELYIADFYFKQTKFTAALRRYENCILKYSGIGFDPRAHMGAIKSAIALKNTDKQKSHSKELITKYPNSIEAKDLISQIENGISTK